MVLFNVHPHKNARHKSGHRYNFHIKQSQLLSCFWIILFAKN